MSLFKKGRERTWFKVLFVVFVTWCFFGKVETSQNGLNQAKINNQIPEKTVKIKHDDPLFCPDDKFGLGFGFFFFPLQLILFSLAFFSWESLIHNTMQIIWNILFPFTIITAGTYNSLRPAITTVSTQTWAVGVLSLKALKQTTKIPRYSWYGLQMLFKLINVKSGKKNNKSQQNRFRRQSRNRIIYAEDGAAINQEHDDDDDDEQNDSESEEMQSFLKRSTSDVVSSQISLKFPFPTSNSVVNEDAVDAKLLAKKQHLLRGRRRGCLLVFKRPTQRSFLTVYRTIPLRLMSRVWGRLMQIRLPMLLRKPIIYIYATVYGCNLTEISLDDVSGYSCLGEFFRRRLRPEVRPIDSSSPLTSPADGKVVQSGLVQNARLEQIKGVSYSLSQFLGAITWKTLAQLSSSTSSTSGDESSPVETLPTEKQSAFPSTIIEIEENAESNFQHSLMEQKSTDRREDEEEKTEEVAVEIPSPISSSSTSPFASLPLASTEKFVTNNNNNNNSMSESLDLDEEYQHQLCHNNPKTHKLHHLVVYLAPGDYHRFHSPADWTVTFRRHFPGDLFSVAPLISRLISGLFNFNERVLYAGFWEHGFFSMTAVGATGVGSIRTHLDPSLSTNEYKWNPRKENLQELDFTKDSPQGIQISKGEDFGEFNLGSTIVLVFEAPNDFRFQFNDADKVKVGQSVGVVGGSVDAAVGGSVDQAVWGSVSVDDSAGDSDDSREDESYRGRSDSQSVCLLIAEPEDLTDISCDDDESFLASKSCDFERKIRQKEEKVDEAEE